MSGITEDGELIESECEFVCSWMVDDDLWFVWG